MTKKRVGRALSRVEDQRDVWQEALEGVRQIKAGGGRRSVVEPRAPIVRARLKAGLKRVTFANSRPQLGPYGCDPEPAT